MAALVPKKKEEKELTKDQKNIRWALNKFFYTRIQNSLSTAYAEIYQQKRKQNSTHRGNQIPPIVC
jgi:CRISPR/Cas system endoribonuclease Cas6 (RAMP superfamily)